MCAQFAYNYACEREKLHLDRTDALEMSHTNGNSDRQLRCIHFHRINMNEMLCRLD